ncbi:MAG: Tex family protein [Planctomycetota bacterium]|jgi:uncharacterized protein|nr:Tex family protein [Planctomycetota bacterium]
MQNKHVSVIAAEQGVHPRQVAATAKLLAGSATVPFIARYRKEATGSLDETIILGIRDRLDQLHALDQRRETILKSLKEQGNLSDELRNQIQDADTLAALEDLYLPYRPKRRTRGALAREKGLEPLARKLFEQGRFEVKSEAARYVNMEKGVATADEALAGARDMIAERINEDSEARARLRNLFGRKAILQSRVARGKRDQAAKYRDYFDWNEPLPRAPSHRILAILRGHHEGLLTISLQPPEQEATSVLERIFVRGHDAASQQVREAACDSYARLLAPSLETEFRTAAKKRADEEAIGVFSDNLRELLLAAPLGQRNVLAVDPGFRTGCKIVCLNRQGKLIHHGTIFPLEPQRREEEAARELQALVKRFKIEALTIGNGTGGREALAFCRDLDLPPDVLVEMVNESGASVYSASPVAREEFPDHDLTVRGAVSIGRRLMDPLAELVKIDPKAIGVGQYQHDVDQKQLKKSLDDTVTSCVNAVGVEVNTASKQLLSYVSGLGPKLAGSIVDYRDANGPFLSRRGLLKVPGLGAKTFEQAVGFLRIRAGKNPLDASAVHPESYPLIKVMASDLGCAVGDFLEKEELRARIDLERYVNDRAGLPTLTDILSELAKPGRDPRSQFEAFSFSEEVHEITDLNPGQRLPGVVTNVTNFGAFVDLGVHQDGLVHISQLADRYVEKPSDIVKVHQKVTVTVLEVDVERKRIALSMRSEPELPGS